MAPTLPANTGPQSVPAGEGAGPWNGTLVRSRIFDALSLLLPAGEAFFVATLERWRTEASPDGVLAAEIDRFIREEHAHARAHARYNAALIDSVPAASAIAARATQVTRDLDSFGMPMKLALVAAFEHLTALLSREIVEHRRLIADNDSRQSRTWHWHAHEELGHCRVAADAAAHAGVGRGLLALALVVATGYLAFDVARYAAALCRCDAARGTSRRKLFGQACGFAAGSLPSLARMACGWWRGMAMPARPR